MMVFWILAGGLATLALAFVLVPLLRRDTGGADPDANALNLDVFRQQLQELDADLALGKLDQAQHEAARRDLERELVHDLAPAATDTATKAGPTGRWAAALLTLAIPVAAVTLYMAIGDQGIIAKLEAAPGAPSAQTGNAAGHSAATMPDGSPMPSLGVLADQLAARLEQKPDNVTGWLMLARTRLTLGQQDEAMAALDRALQVAPRDPTVLLTYAELLAESNGQQFSGKPAAMLDTLLEVEPNNPNGLWLRGLAAFQTDDFPGALARWEPLLPLLEPGSQDATEIAGLIDEARSRSGQAPNQAPLDKPMAAQEPTPAPAAAPAAPATPQVPVQAAPQPVAASAPAAAGITVTVALDPALATQAPQDATVFIYAKAVAGPPMPLAAQRVRVSDLPITLTLDDSMAMMPQMRLSNFDQVVVGARISRSGNATPQSGDLQGEVKPVTPGQAETVAVVIDSVRP